MVFNTQSIGGYFTIKPSMNNIKERTLITDISRLTNEDFKNFYSSFIPKILELQTTLSKASSELEYFKWLDFDYLLKTNISTKKLAKEKKNFKTVLVIGMGGSGINSLVLKNALYEFAPLAKRKSDINLIIQNNLDTSSMLSRLESLDLNDTLLLIISKSGGTDEVRRNLNTIINYWQSKSTFNPVKLATNSVIITEPPQEGKKNFLHDYAAELKKLTGIDVAYLENDPNIGGRFSMFSPVGMLSAELMGIDSDLLIHAAKQVFDDFIKVKAEDNTLAKLAALDIYYARKNITNRYSMVYSDSLEALNKFRAQLKGESLNKNSIDSTVHIPGIGTVNHHSDLELLLKTNNGVILEQVYFASPFADHVNSSTFDCLKDLESSSNHQTLIDKHVKPLAEYISNTGAPVIQTILAEQEETSIAKFCMQDMLVTVVQAGMQDEIESNVKLDLAIRQWEVERYKKSVK
jgi:glucose-6-phosphate isomerase